MEKTYQFENINMLEHGHMVHEAYLELKNDLLNQKNNMLNLNIQQTDWLIKNQYDIETMRNYHVYHDCGKPYCRTVNPDGKQQFPNHAQISYEIYKRYFDNDTVSILILMDMNFHFLKSEDLEKWLNIHKNNPNLLASLYLTAWSELIANSSMFGGYDTTSFKIKKKALIRAGKKLFNILNN